MHRAHVENMHVQHMSKFCLPSIMDNDDESRNWIPHPKYYDPQCGPYPTFRVSIAILSFVRGLLILDM